MEHEELLRGKVDQTISLLGQIGSSEDILLGGVQRTLGLTGQIFASRDAFSLRLDFTNPINSMYLVLL
jgi:hypothetical protein